MGYQDYDDDDDQETTGLPKELRSQIKKLQKQLDEQTKELDGYRQKETRSKVASVLKGRGVPPGYSRLILADGVDASDESAIDKWITDNAEEFGFAVEEAPSDEEVDVADRFARLSNSRAQGRDGNALENALQRISAAKDKDDLGAFLQSLQ